MRFESPLRRHNAQILHQSLSLKDTPKLAQNMRQQQRKPAQTLDSLVNVSQVLDFQALVQYFRVQFYQNASVGKLDNQDVEVQACLDFQGAWHRGRMGRNFSKIFCKIFWSQNVRQVLNYPMIHILYFFDARKGSRIDVL